MTTATTDKTKIWTFVVLSFFCLGLPRVLTNTAAFTLTARLATWLTPGGWIAVQAGAETVRPGLLDLAGLIEDRVRRVFGDARRDAVLIPSYGEKNAFVTARR